MFLCPIHMPFWKLQSWSFSSFIFRHCLKIIPKIMPDRHQMLHIYLTLQWRPFLSAIITCEMNSIIFLVVNTVCELFSWRMYFLSIWLYYYFSTVYKLFCQSIVIMLMLWHFSANQISFLIVTGMLIGCWKTIIVLSVLHSQGTYFSLVPVLFGTLLDPVGILLEETLMNVGAWANIQSQMRGFETWVISQGIDTLLKTPKQL